jgi:competence protein ComEC
MPRSAGVAVGAATAALVVAPGWPSPAIWLGLVAGALAAVSLRRLLRSSRDLPLAAIVGFAAIVVRLALSPTSATVPPTLPDGQGPWTACVESVAAPREGRLPAILRLDEPPGMRIAATLPRFPAVEPGHRVLVTGELRPPPDDDPYGEYLRRIGVAGMLRSRTLAVVPSAERPLDMERWRRAAASALTVAVPEPEAGLAAGILVGLRDRVDRALAADFTTVGASHVVAISGWNIAIVAACMASIGGRLKRRRRSVLTVAAIAAYVAFVGPSPSVVRAGVMAGVVLLARESGRAGRAAAALAWAAAIILLLDPAMVRDAGFQLSTLATGGLIAWGTPLATTVDRVTGHRLPGWVVECLGVSLAAQAATLPIVLASFGRLAIVSPLVNLLVVPAVAPAMAAGALALVAGFLALAGLPGVVATIGGLPAWVLLGWIVGAVRAGAAVPFASIELTPPVDTLAALAVTAGIGLVAGRQRLSQRLATIVGRALALKSPAPAPKAGSGVPARRAHRAVAVALVGATIAFGLAVVHRPDGRSTVTVLDVGQGDAILVEGARGGRLLVDGGPDPDRLLVALDERLPPWDRRLDALILTHPHEDHVAGLALLLERYAIGRVFEPGMRGPGPGYEAWLAALESDGPPVGRLATGDRIWVDDIGLDVLWPDPGTVPEQPPDTGTGINNVSIVLLGEVDGRRFLLTGDVEEEIDPLLLARGLPAIDILKVAHHGSRTASTDAFLEAVRPAVAVVSAGSDNPYGHPSPDTVARLEEAGSRVFRTDLDGSVELSIDGGRIRAASSGPRGTTGPAVAIAAAALPQPGFACAIPEVDPTRFAANPPLPSGP